MEDENVLYVVVGEHCPPCLVQHSIIDEMDLTVDVAYVDAGDAGDLISKYTLRSTPAIVFNNEVLRGLTRADELSEFIGEHYKG